MNKQTHRYNNPWSSYQKPSLLFALQHLLGPSTPNLAGLPDLPVVHPAIFDGSQVKEPRMMWLGHASCYLQLPATSSGCFGILFDPIFSLRCSPSKLFGPKRRMPTPCDVSDLPRIDLVVISHDHYDHLDKATILDIERYHQHVKYLVPSGIKRILGDFGVNPDRVQELGWWDETTIVTENGTKYLSKEHELDVIIPSPTFELSEDDPPLSPTSTFFSQTTLTNDTSITATCCPAQHNSGRGLFSQHKTLWASWYLTCRLPDGGKYRVYFGGDTGYRSTPTGPVCPIFKEIKDRLGPPDLALLPIAAGACLPFLERFLHIRLDQTSLTRHLHSPPQDAVQVHRDLGARSSIGIHWGTFTTDLGARQTRADFEKVKEGGFELCDVGVWTAGRSKKVIDDGDVVHIVAKKTLMK